jgi:catecholate siderophore receptor
MSAASELPPLRSFMGSAMGMALAHAASAQNAAPPPASPQPSGDGPVQLPQISVQGGDSQSGYQAAVPSLSKLTQPLLDTPESISVIPRQLMEDQAVTAVRDALRNVPGVSLAAGEAGAQGDSLTLRGFSARNDFYLDGMRDFGSYYRDPFNLQSIEVLKGPASVLFGRGSTGGVINQVSKQPLMTPLTDATTVLGTDGTYRFTTDIDRPIEGIDNSAVRLNVMGNLNGISERRSTEYRRLGFAPSVAFGIGTDTRLNINYYHLQEYDTPDYGLPWLFTSPAPVSRDTYYGFAKSDYFRSNVNIGTVKLEHDINDHVTLRDQFRYASYGRSGRITEPQVIYPGVTGGTPLGNINVNRNEIAVTSTETDLDNQADATIRFNTGFLQHTVVAGVEFTRETSDPVRLTYSGVQTANLLFPDSSLPFTAPSRISTSINTTSNTYSAFLIDTLELGEHWEIIGGFRFDSFTSTYKQFIAPAVFLNRTDNMPSWRTALVYKPTTNGSVYFAWGTSFNPSAETLSLAVNTAGLAPEENETYEIGSKWLLDDGRLTVSGAVFQIAKTNARVPDPTNSAFNILGGNQRVRGFEVGMTGYLTDRWEIYTGYSFLNSKVVASTLPATVGQPLGNTPQNTFSLWNTYHLPWYGLEVGGGVQYVGSRIASSTPNSTTGLIEIAPSYYTLQAMVKYPVRPGIDVQLNANNISNVRYYDLLHPAHVVPGAGTSVLLTTSFKL